MEKDSGKPHNLHVARIRVPLPLLDSKQNIPLESSIRPFQDPRVQREKVVRLLIQTRPRAKRG